MLDRSIPGNARVSLFRVSDIPLLPRLLGLLQTVILDPSPLSPPPLLLASEGIPFTSKPAVCLLGTVKWKPLSYQSGVLGSRSGPVTWNTQLLWVTNTMQRQRAPHQLN